MQKYLKMSNTKIIAIGDIHGYDSWKKIVNQEENATTFVMVGDYFDSYTVNTEDQINNFLDIIAFKKSRPDDVILLIGNHDHHYIVGDTGTSGFQHVGSFQICPVINDNLQYLQYAYQHDNFLFTHAGVSEVFMNDIFGKEGWAVDNIAIVLNELGRHKPHAFTFNGYNSTGDDSTQTPIWIRPRSLMASSQSIKKAGIVQVVGHTHMRSIDIKGKATGGKYFFIDTMFCGEYLIIEDGKVKLGKINKDK